MALYAIGDLHLCLGAAKPMDVFGGAWLGYMEKLKTGLSAIGPEDTTVLMGDLSWGLDQPDPREKDSVEGQPRLLVEHSRQIPELLPGKRLFGYVSSE